MIKDNVGIDNVYFHQMLILRTPNLIFEHHVTTQNLRFEVGKTRHLHIILYILVKIHKTGEIEFLLR